MHITLTLSEALNRCDDWDKLCEDLNINPWAVNEGFGDSELSITEEQALRHGLVSVVAAARRGTYSEQS